MDIIVKILIWLTSFWLGLMAMGLFTLAYGFIEAGIYHLLSKEKTQEEQQQEPPKLVYYSGILVGIIFWFWFLFFFALPFWDCYWNNICLS